MPQQAGWAVHMLSPAERESQPKQPAEKCQRWTAQLSFG